MLPKMKTLALLITFTLAASLFLLATNFDNSIQGMIVFSEGGELKMLQLPVSEKGTPIAILRNPSQEFRFPSWVASRLGQVIIFAYGNLSDLKTKGGYIYSVGSVDHSGKDFRKIVTLENSNVEYATYSRDGNFLAVTSYSVSDDSRTKISGKLTIINSESLKTVKTIEDVYPFDSPSWSLKNDLLVFATNNHRIANYDISSDSLKVLPIQGRSPILSPDSNMIFFLENDDKSKRIFSMQSDGSNRAKIAERDIDKQKSNASSFDQLITVSRDGRWIFLVGYGNVVGKSTFFEFRTLEFLNIAENRFLEVYSSGTLMGASWYEPN
jgi:Tol biopolymer transport system component